MEVDQQQIMTGQQATIEEKKEPEQQINSFVEEGSSLAPTQEIYCLDENCPIKVPHKHDGDGEPVLITPPQLITTDK